MERIFTTFEIAFNGYNPMAGKLYMYQYGLDFEPTAAQMKAFYTGVAKVTVAIAAADGVLDPSERLFLKNLGVEMGLTIPEGETDALCDAAEAGVKQKGLDAIITEVGKAVKEKSDMYPGLAKRMIYCGVCVATADGVLDPKEKLAATKLAELAGLPATFVDDAYAIAKMEEEFKKKRGMLVSDNHPALMAKRY